MKEPELKAWTLNKLREVGKIDRRSILASEFCLGQTGLRADLAVHGKTLFGVEIKSEADSLRRLPTQLSIYKRHFDWTLLVVASSHIKSVVEQNSEDLEVWECTKNGNLHIVREACTRIGKIEADWTSLMTQAERNLITDDKNPRDAFQNVFDSRFLATSKQFWSEVGRRKITPDHLALLSRFREARLADQRIATEQAAFWRDFSEKAQALAIKNTPDPIKAA